MASLMFADDLSNDFLKEAFQELHVSLVRDLVAGDITDHLFAAKVLSVSDLEDVNSISKPREQIKHLLILLHKLKHPKAFIELQRALLSREHGDKYKWLVNELDKKYNEISHSMKQDPEIELQDTTLVSGVINMQPDSYSEQQLLQQQQRAKAPSVAAAPAPLEKETFPAVKLVHLFPESEPVFLVTTLDKELYVCYRDQSDLTVYDAETFNLRRRLSVKGLNGVNDMASCKKNQCIYIADHVDNVVHRIEKANNRQRKWWSFFASADISQTKWSVGDDWPHGLAVNYEHNVIATFYEVQKVKVFTTHGVLLREINLRQSDIDCPRHTVQLTTDKYVISHGDYKGPLHRVVVVDGRGQIQQSFGCFEGSNDDQLNVPGRLALVKTGYLLVADINNKRMVMLSTTLRFVKSWQLSGEPYRIWFDNDTDRLYVCVNSDWNADTKEYNSGHVEVYCVSG